MQARDQQFCGWWANHPVLVTAVRLRFGMNANGLVWAAARDGWPHGSEGCALSQSSQ